MLREGLERHPFFVSFRLCEVRSNNLDVSKKDIVEGPTPFGIDLLSIKQSVLKRGHAQNIKLLIYNYLWF